MCPDLLCANDVLLASTDKRELKRKVCAWGRKLASFGLRFNIRKTEHLANGTSVSVRTEGTQLLRTKAFLYLRMKIVADGNMYHKVNAGINAG